MPPVSPRSSAHSLGGGLVFNSDPTSPAHSSEAREQRAVSSIPPSSPRSTQPTSHPSTWLNWFDRSRSASSATQVLPLAATRTAYQEADFDKRLANAEICAAYMLHINNHQQIAHQIVITLDNALSSAFGSNIPVAYANLLADIKNNAEQARQLFESVRDFAPSNRTHRARNLPVTPANLRQTAEAASQAEQHLITCARLLTELIETGTPAQHSNPLPPTASADPLSKEHIARDLATIASPAFRHRLISTLPPAASIQRRLLLAGNALLRAPERAAEWLIPILKNDNPQTHAQYVAQVLQMTETLVTINKCAKRNVAIINRCVTKSLCNNPALRFDTAGATQSVAVKHATELLDQTKSHYRDIDAAVKAASYLSARGPRTWGSVGNAQRDMEKINTLKKQAGNAYQILEKLVGKAKTLPYAGPHATSSDCDSDSDSDSDSDFDSR